MEPVVIAALVLLVLLVAGYFVLRSRRGSCKTSADCIPPSICQNGKCGLAPPEAFYYSIGPGQVFEDAQQTAAALGMKIATIDQVSAAYAAGAGPWCNYGWVADSVAGSRQIAYVSQSSDCDLSGHPPGVVTTDAGPEGGLFGINLYGPKPLQGLGDDDQNQSCKRSGAMFRSDVACLYPFSDTKWSQYDP